MAMDFGKLNFAVGFNRTSAFPLEANSYFESYDAAVLAAASAVEVGSADSAYYIGQIIIVKDATVGVGLYQINAGKTLTKFGQASSADELAEKISALETRCTTIEGKLILATAEKDGFLSKEDFTKLSGIAAGAQVNIIEGVQLDGADLTVGEDKKVNIALADIYAKKADYVAKEEGKGLSTNDYTNADKAEVNKVKDKADSTVVEGIETRVGTLETKIAGVTGAMHFKGVLTELPSDLSSYESGDVVIVGSKEYVCAVSGDIKAWYELGDEGSHLTKTEAAATYKTIESYNTDKAVIDASISALEQNVNEISSDYLKAADKTELEGKIEIKANQADLDTANNAATALKGRVDVIENDYLKAADKTELNEAIGLKADKAELETANGKITTLENKVGNATSGDIASTGLFKAIDDEVAARGKVETRVGVLETGLNALNTNVGTADDAAAADGTLFARVKQLNEDLTSGLEQAGKIDGITINGEAVTIENKIAQITLPAAFIDGLKEGETDLVVNDGKLELAKVSTDKLVQGAKVIVLNGGNAND